MRPLLIVGGGLFGAQAAAYARRKGMQALVFDPGLTGAASHAAAGLFKQEWMGKKYRHHFHSAVGLLDQLYGIRHVHLGHEDGSEESFLFVPPALIIEPAPIRELVSAVGDGWLQTGDRRYEGWVYIAAGVWSATFLPGLKVQGKAGASFAFAGERRGHIRSIGPGRQAIAFVRDATRTYFSDGTAELHYTPEHDRQTLDRAEALGLADPPLQRFWGQRPYTPGGPVFLKLGERTWLATGGRKMGTILGASFARRLIDEEIGL